MKKASVFYTVYKIVRHGIAARPSYRHCEATVGCRGNLKSDELKTAFL